MYFTSFANKGVDKQEKTVLAVLEVLSYN
jgi:hypothetical protein